MDEVVEFCRRVLGAGASADQAVAEARSAAARSAEARSAPADGGRVALLAAAARACRTRAGELDSAEGGSGRTGLAGTVDAEMQTAASKLPERHREALALREALRLSHEQIAVVSGLDAAAVAPLLARARLALREQRRGVCTGVNSCPDRDRALRSLARRQDSEPLAGDDEAWLLAHLGACEECDRAHAAMIEASVCYRAWSPPVPDESVNRAAPVAVSSAE